MRVCMNVLMAAWLLTALAGLGQPARGAEEAPREGALATSAAGQTDSAADHETVTLRGHLTWWADALQKLHGVQTVPEAREHVVVLQTEDQQLFPLVEDVRGRGIRRDERLRDVPVELLVRRHRGSPFIQVIRFFVLREDGKYEVDYWCDVCAIATFESKPCECCQAPVELRERRVEP